MPPATRGTVRMWKRGLRHGKAKRQAQMRERRKKNRVKSKETAKSASEAGKKNREKKQTNKERCKTKKIMQVQFRETLSVRLRKSFTELLVSFSRERTTRNATRVARTYSSTWCRIHKIKMKKKKKRTEREIRTCKVSIS